MHILYFAFLYFKVVKDGGIVPHETCIEEKKFELIKKSCNSEFHKRKSLTELKESLQNMLTDAGISNYSLIICFLSLMYYFFEVFLVSWCTKGGSITSFTELKAFFRICLCCYLRHARAPSRGSWGGGGRMRVPGMLVVSLGDNSCIFWTHF